VRRRRQKARGTNGAAERQTQLEELKKHQHARCEATRVQTRSARTGDEGGGIGGNTAAFGSADWWVLGAGSGSGSPAYGFGFAARRLSAARRTQLAALAPSS
jgi:hypothetical protein